MAISRTQTIGLAIVMLGLVIGIGGTGLSIYGAFFALETAEFTGLGTVTDSIQNALIFTVVGLIASIAGAVMLIFGRSKRPSS